MRIVSVHSHKGGSGKTSVVVSLAAELAQTEKVCIIEADIGGPGLEQCLKFQNPQKYLNDYIIADTLKPGEPDIEAEPRIMLAQYKGDDIPTGNLSAIVCSQERNAIDKALLFAANEREHRWIRRGLWRILQELEKEEPKLDWCLFDCSPGFDGASEATLAVTLRANGVPIFVSTPDRSHVSGTVRFLNSFLTVPEVSESTPITLVVNRVTEEEEFSKNSKAFYDAIDSDEIMDVKVSTLIRQEQRIRGYFAIKDNEGWKKRFRIGSDGEIAISIKLDYQSDLDKSTISEGLKQEFKKKNISLSQEAKIDILETGSKWIIKDGDIEFTVRKWENLKIYHHGEEEVITKIVNSIRSFF